MKKAPRQVRVTDVDQDEWDGWLFVQIKPTRGQRAAPTLLLNEDEARALLDLLRLRFDGTAASQVQ